VPDLAIDVDCRGSALLSLLVTTGKVPASQPPRPHAHHKIQREKGSAPGLPMGICMVGGRADGLPTVVESYLFKHIA